VSLLHVARVRRILSAHLLCEVPGAGPRFALTFDDGPSARNTPALLDVLEKHRARATFFLMTGRARRHPDLVGRAVAAGHEIGIHGGVHLPGWSLPRPLFDRELTDAIASLTTVTGRRPRHYRAPFGLLFPAQARWAREQGVTAVLGSIYPRDHAARSAAEIVARVLPRLGPGMIVILHDSSALGDADRAATVGAVDAILTAAAHRGLESTTVEGLVAGSAGTAAH
jgi:peptidoglycan/xylan/chitin deacetylase (PgdA/CDA1 family)